MIVSESLWRRMNSRNNVSAKSVVKSVVHDRKRGALLENLSTNVVVTLWPRNFISSGVKDSVAMDPQCLSGNCNRWEGPRDFQPLCLLRWHAVQPLQYSWTSSDSFCNEIHEVVQVFLWKWSGRGQKSHGRYGAALWPILVTHEAYCLTTAGWLWI